MRTNKLPSKLTIIALIFATVLVLVIGYPQRLKISSMSKQADNAAPQTATEVASPSPLKNKQFRVPQPHSPELPNIKMVSDYALEFIESAVDQQSQLPQLLQERLKDSNIQIRYKLGLISALSAFPNAEDLWIAITENSDYQDDLRTQAIISLANYGQWTLKAVQSLEKLANGEDPIALAAQTNLGTFARLVAEQDPSYITQVEASMRTHLQLALAQNDEDRARALVLSLGATRKPEYLSDIQATLLSPSSLLRRSALEAAAESGQAQAQTLIVQSLLEDPDPMVRLTAARKLNQFEQPSQMFDEVRDAAYQEEDPEVRQALAGVLVGMQSIEPRSAEVLTWLIQNEEDQEAYEGMIETLHAKKTAG